MIEIDDIKSNLLKSANEALKQIQEPDILFETNEEIDPKITNREVIAVALAMEQVINRLANLMDAKFREVDRALINISKLGVIQH